MLEIAFVSVYIRIDVKIQFKERCLIMSITLTSQMNSVFEYGIKVMQKHEEPIIQEWENILLHLKKTKERSFNEMEEAIGYFKNLILKLTYMRKIQRILHSKNLFLRQINCLLVLKSINPFLFCWRMLFIQSFKQTPNMLKRITKQFNMYLTK